MASPRGRDFATSDSARRYRWGRVVTALLVLAGSALAAAGAFAWASPRAQARELVPGEATTLTATPWFDTGVTVFVPAEGAARDPRSWSCTRTREGQRRELHRRPDPDVAGTRVAGNAALVPMVDVGVTEPGDRLRCSGPAATVTAWALPTDTGVRRTPMTLVVAGVALIGAGAILHPRARGLRVFPRGLTD